MRQNKKGSILLYVLFLSSFLVLFFVSFQGELEKLLEWAKTSEKNAQDRSGTKDALVLLRNAPSATKTVDTNENLSLISLNQSGTVFFESLGWNDSREYWITSTGWETSFSLNIALWGPISYHLAAFNSWSESSSVLVSSGVIITNGSINLSGSFDQHLLVIESLGWYTQFALSKWNSTTIPANSSYRLERDINGYKKDEWTYDVVSFAPHVHTGIDYQKMGMYLKQ